MTNEGSSETATRRAPFTTAVFPLAGCILGGAPGVFLYISALWAGRQGDLISMGSVIIAFVGSAVGMALGLLVGGIVWWFRKSAGAGKSS